jgi:hypothetical protein
LVDGWLLSSLIASLLFKLEDACMFTCHCGCFLLHF